MAKVNHYFENSKAKFKLRLFDACHSGRMGMRGMPNPSIEKHLAINAAGWATLAACKEDESAHELQEIGHGVFSYFIVNGLRGEAAVPHSGQVTLDSLKVYVMNQTIELTKKRGMTQTPVFRGEQAGNLILSLVAKATAALGSKPEDKLPPVLETITNMNVADLAPKPSRTNEILAGLTSIIRTPRPTAKFVAANVEQRSQVAQTLVSEMISWTTERVKDDGSRLPEGHRLIAYRHPLEKVALNKELAQYLKNSKVSTALNVEFTHEEQEKLRTRTVYEETEVEIPRSPFTLASFRSSPSIQKTRKPVERTESYTVQVLTGVCSPKGPPEAGVELRYALRRQHFLSAL
ncbi:MAG: hypothetical protein IPM54_29560 [Polyangiaceae bacterium]|nr:hypothetical protein [Polyangiaceae bacterium]